MDQQQGASSFDKQYRVVTVVLRNDSPIVRKNFHCLSCGKLVFQYYSETKLVFDGGVSPNQAKRPIDAMCHRCKTIYRID